MAFLFIFTDLLSESRFEYKLPFYLSKGKSCFLFGYIWFQSVRAVPIDELHNCDRILSNTKNVAEQ